MQSHSRRLASAITLRKLAGLAFLFIAAAINAQESKENALPTGKFLGASSCSSSGCHGGATAHRNQNSIWSRLDVHSSRPYATLTTRRSERIAEVLSITNAPQSLRCTVCHAPFHGVPEAKRATTVDIIEGVSCENCHGPAEAWLRPHTRGDFSHEDRIQAGMRDLKNLYVRANSCVACHQNVDTDLLKAGHPELIFELDGQSVSEPKHWRESDRWFGPKSWLVGQAVALREMSWQLAQQTVPDERLTARWAGLLWLLSKPAGVKPNLPDLAKISFPPAQTNFTRAQQLADQLASQAAKYDWSHETTLKWLRSLAESQADFADKQVAVQIHGRRAERLVLALDRLVMAQENDALKKSLNTQLNDLFAAVQSLPDFDAARFATGLETFSKKFKLGTEK